MENTLNKNIDSVGNNIWENKGDKVFGSKLKILWKRNICWTKKYWWYEIYKW